MVQHQKNNSPVHELKFVINNTHSQQVIGWLKRTCGSDPEFPAGTVSSIYYDTRNWDLLAEKINSDYLKTKVRVRWYADIERRTYFKRSFAEAKFKTGARREKLRVETDYSGNTLAAMDLCSPELLRLPYLLYSENFSFQKPLYPVFQISYKRFRFIEPASRARICFDYDISAPRVNRLMLSCFNPSRLQTAVFEIKGHVTELPYALHMLTDMGLKKASFSKYGACYKKIKRMNT